MRTQLKERKPSSHGHDKLISLRGASILSYPFTQPEVSFVNKSAQSNKPATPIISINHESATSNKRRQHKGLPPPTPAQQSIQSKHNQTQTYTTLHNHKEGNRGTLHTYADRNRA